MKAAETGHLLVSTLHTPDAQSTILRIMAMFPPEEQDVVRVRLAETLQAVISQRLVRTKTGARIPAVEILLNTRNISELIEKGDISEIKEALEKSLAPGSQTFEQALCKLYLDGRISYDEAMVASDSATNLAWLINQATAGELSLSGAAGAAQRPPEEKKDGLLSGAGGNFNDFKIDVNA